MSTQDFISEINKFRTNVNIDVVNTDNLYLDLEIPELPSWLDVVQKELNERTKVLNSIANKHLQDLPVVRLNAAKQRNNKRKGSKKRRKYKSESCKETELILPNITQCTDDLHVIKTEYNITESIPNSNDPQLTNIEASQDISDDSILTAVKTLAIKQSSSTDLPIIKECISKIKSKLVVLKQESKNNKTCNKEPEISKQDSIIEYINKFDKSVNLENLSNLNKVATKIRFLQNVLTDHGNKTFYYCAAPNFKENNKRNKRREGSGLNTVCEKEAESIFSDCQDDDESLFSDA